MLRATCLCAAALLVCHAAFAQDYGGTYTAKNPSGGTVTLTLAHEAGQQVNGTLTGHGSTSLEVRARSADEELRGTAGNAFGMLYVTGRLKGEELSLVLTEPDVGGKPNPKRATTLRLAKLPVKIAPQGGRLGNALMQNAWCSSAYTISGQMSKERLQFRSDGVVNQAPGKLARWRVQNEILEFSRDGTRWAREPLQLALNSSGSPVLRGYGKEYLQCD